MRAVVAAVVGAGLLLGGTTVFIAGVATRGSDRVVQTAPASDANRRVRLPAVSPAIRLQVDVHGAGVATQGTYTVRVGTRTLASGAWSGQGFTTPVVSASDTDLVHVDVRADQLHFVSTLGGFSRLVQRAGADRLLTVDEHDALRVSPLSTAVDFLVAHHAGGRPTTESAFEAGLRSIDMADVTSAASALDWFARAPSELPAGFADGRALLADRAAFNTHVPYGSAPLADAEAVLAAMPAAVLSAADVASGLALVDSVHDLDRPVHTYGAQVLTSTASGTFQSYGRARTDPEFVAAPDQAGGLLLVPTHREVETYTHDNVVCPATQQQRTTLRRLASERFKRLRSGAGVDLWAVTQRYTVSLDQCPSLPESFYEETRLRAGVKLENGVARAPWAAWEGRRSLPEFRLVFYRGPVLEQWNHAVHVFERNGEGTREGIGWWVDSGMRPRDDTTRGGFSWSSTRRGQFERDADGINTRFWLVDVGEPGVSGWVHVAQTTVDQRTATVAGYSPILSWRANTPPVAFDPIGVWVIGHPIRYVIDMPFEDLDAGWSFGADGRFTFVGRWTSLGRWMFEGDRVYLMQVRNSQRQALPYHDCEEAEAAGVTGCLVSRARVFQPLMEIGGGVAGIERNYVVTWNAQGQPSVVDLGGTTRILRAVH